MTKTLTQYIPQDRLRALAYNETLPDRTSGSVMFADISGFTSLTEALHSALGARRGAEELTKYLDAVYTVLIAEVERYGGSVIDFAGDGITCWFDEEVEHSTLNNQPAVQRAVACALALQAAMKPFEVMTLPTGAIIVLALKVAVATGPVRRFVIGDPEIRWMDVLAGATLMRMALGERLANKGEVLVDSVTVEKLGAALTIVEWRDVPETQERFAVASHLALETLFLLPLLPLPKLTHEILRPWLHHPVYEREKSGQGMFLAEFRPCVAMFIRFTGIDYDAPAAEPYLNDFLCRVQAIALEYDGSLLSVTIGDKGSYVCLAFGALTIHEDDVRRAVRAALDVRDMARKLNFIQPVQIGLSQGVPYVGAYGGSTRRTFGTLGSDVNLAALLMQHAAPGEILLSERMQNSVGKIVTLEPHLPVQVKGNAEFAPVFAVTEIQQQRAIRLQEPTYDLPLVGRQVELQVITEKLELALQGKGQVIGVVADAGLGKSRLVAEVIRVARRKGFVGYGGACQSDGLNASYLVWKPIWNAFFNLNSTVTQDELLRTLEDKIKNCAPSRLNALPLLGQTLDLHAPIPDNEFTRALEPKIRKSAMCALLEDCLKAAASSEPILIVIEDMHWIDALSYDLLEELARVTADLSICLVLAYRPPQLARLNAPRLESLSYFTKIKLGELSPVECEQVICAKLAQIYSTCDNIPPVLVNKLLARAQGNPFYLEEMLNYLHDRGFDPCDPIASEKIAVPDSLHTLILSRIDQLSEREKTTLRVASIIGRLFRANWLTGYYPALGHPDQVKFDLDKLDKLDITPMETPEPELIYVFKHIVTHEVAYESLSFATRAQLHEQLAQYLETIYFKTPVLDTLAYHYEKSNNLPKKIEYLQKAGDAAQAVFANESALDYYARLWPLLTTAEEKMHLHLKWGAVLDLIGQWEQAETHYLAALELSQTCNKSVDETISSAHSQFVLGKLYRQRGDYSTALKWLEQARAGLAVLDNQKELSESLIEIGYTYWRKGDYEVGRQYAEEGITLARTLGDKPGIALALNNLGLIAYFQNDYMTARALCNESLLLRRELGDKSGMASSLNNLGIFASDQGDYSTALLFYKECLDLRREMGDKPGVAGVLNNLGVVAHEQGNCLAARTYQEESLKLYREIGDKWGIATTITNLGDVALDQGDYAIAKTLHEDGLKLSREIGDKSGSAYALLGLGIIALHQSEIDASHSFIVESLKLSDEIGDKLRISSCLVGLAGLFLCNGDYLRSTQQVGVASALLTLIEAKMESIVRPIYDHTIATAQTMLGEEAFHSAFAEGQAMPLEQVIALALD